MNRKNAFITGLVLLGAMLFNAGCALLGAAAAAGMSYGIYQATRH